jgi:aminoglycoside 3-N-acetyltransferase
MARGIDPPAALDEAGLLQGLRALGLPPAAPVIAHASLSAFGHVEGGALTLARALAAAFPAGLLMPAFTYKTMLIPETGPPDNALDYGLDFDRNRMAEFWRSDLPVDRLIGATAEALRGLPGAQRSTHPILSFCGVNAWRRLAAQTLEQPLAPIFSLRADGGWVLLLGVDHTANTSLHAAEALAGRRRFTRWVLTSAGVAACPNFPGCSDGFEAAAPVLAAHTRTAWVGAARLRALPLSALFSEIAPRLRADPGWLLCSHSYCARCAAVRLGLPAGTNLAIQVDD